MMVISRKLREELVVERIDDSARQLKVTVLEINDGSVNLGIELGLENPAGLDQNNPGVRSLIARLSRDRHRKSD